VTPDPEFAEALEQLRVAEETETAAWRKAVAARARYEALRRGHQAAAASWAYFDFVTALHAVADPLHAVVSASGRVLEAWSERRSAS
jgi:hypothetical protein